MSEFWLISAPGDKENLQALERMNNVTSKSNLSHNTKFAIPDFKVGTLDSLVGLSDELGKLDTFAERASHWDLGLSHGVAEVGWPGSLRNLPASASPALVITS
uniref:V-type proton ATPase subunit C n=1 Tax=Mus musculus TaxID=10090 RepID=A0A1Y7VLG0_MOUSE